MLSFLHHYVGSLSSFRSQTSFVFNFCPVFLSQLQACSWKDIPKRTLSVSIDRLIFLPGTLPEDCILGIDNKFISRLYFSFSSFSLSYFLILSGEFFYCGQFQTCNFVPLSKVLFTCICAMICSVQMVNVQRLSCRRSQTNKYLIWHFWLGLHRLLLEIQNKLLLELSAVHLFLVFLNFARRPLRMISLYQEIVSKPEFTFSVCYSIQIHILCML